MRKYLPLLQLIVVWNSARIIRVQVLVWSKYGVRASLTGVQSQLTARENYKVQFIDDRRIWRHHTSVLEFEEARLDRVASNEGTSAKPLKICAIRDRAFSKDTNRAVIYVRAFDKVLAVRDEFHGTIETFWRRVSVHKDGVLASPVRVSQWFL